MKKFTNVKSGGVILTLLLLALVSGSVWGQEVVHVFTKYDKQVITDDQKGTWKTSVASTTSNELPADFSATSAKSRGVAFGANAEVTSDFVVENISELIIEASSNERGNSLSVKVGDVELSPKTSTLPKVNHETYSFKSSEPLSGQITISIQRSKKTVWIGGVTIKSSGSANQVRMPVFTPVTGSLFKDKLTVTASSPTEGATIYYTKDGAEPTTGSDKFPTEGVTLTETTTLKAIAVKDGLDNSEVVTATYTKLEPYTSLKALKESGIATAEGVTCFVELKDAVVTYADSRKAYIQDETAGLYVFGSNNLKVGTKLNGVVSAQLALYNGLYELKVEGGEFDNVEVTEGVEIPVQVVTVAELNQNFAQYESMRVKVVDATVTSGFNNKNGEIEQNGEKIALRAADESITADVQATVDVTGYPGLFHSDKQLNVILQEDITVKTAGKTQATLAFEQDAYSVNLGESLIIKATTNSTSPITYSSEDEEIAKVDSEGKVQAGNKTGMVTITATVTENDEFTGATATCTVNVVDPSALPEAKALVAEKDGVYYAMLSSNKISDKKLDTDVVDVLNNKVVKTSETVDFDFYIDESKGTIQTVSGGYVAHIGNSTDLGVDTKKFTWKKESDGYWHSSTNSARVLGLGVSSGNSVFGTYSLSSTTNQFATDMPIVDGYVRNVASGDYGTICLPYAVVAEDMAGADFFSIAGKVMKDGEPQSMVLEQVTTLEVGVPYIFSATSDKLIAAYSGKAVAEAGEANGLVGSFEGQDVAEGMYLISAQNKVQLCGKGCKISGNRAYIDMDKVPEYSGEVGVNQRLISFEDATGISETMVEGGLADVYTLSGVEVRHQVNESEATQGLPQGIYIVNGKKVVVK
ncbi:chitobiase/beta-hexosaminidase C-terminal domain-containing protein [Paraprevotella xylaniphila]|uniref:chitobiase/beta-hexosaminidase C-terminal domain-containing protein n=1 Tax=Paraprevotella xylaniphila TaxID=454155 RepID=UPI003AB3311C